MGKYQDFCGISLKWIIFDGYIVDGIAEWKFQIYVHVLEYLLLLLFRI
jgi:hypothetical protein